MNTPVHRRDLASEDVLVPIEEDRLRKEPRKKELLEEELLEEVPEEPSQDRNRATIWVGFRWHLVWLAVLAFALWWMLGTDRTSMISVLIVCGMLWGLWGGSPSRPLLGTLLGGSLAGWFATTLALGFELVPARDAKNWQLGSYELVCLAVGLCLLAALAGRHVAGLISQSHSPEIPGEYTVSGSMVPSAAPAERPPAGQFRAYRHAREFVKDPQQRSPTAEP